MSDETKGAVEAALLAHMLDECDEEAWLMTDWLCIVAARSSDLERTNYLHVRADMPFHSHLGLCEALRLNLKEAWNADD